MVKHNDVLTLGFKFEPHQINIFGWSEKSFENDNQTTYVLVKRTQFHKETRIWKTSSGFFFFYDKISHMIFIRRHHTLLFFSVTRTHTRGGSRHNFDGYPKNFLYFSKLVTRSFILFFLFVYVKSVTHFSTGFLMPKYGYLTLYF